MLGSQETKALAAIRKTASGDSSPYMQAIDVLQGETFDGFCPQFHSNFSSFGESSLGEFMLISEITKVKPEWFHDARPNDHKPASIAAIACIVGCIIQSEVLTPVETPPLPPPGDTPYDFTLSRHSHLCGSLRDK